MSRIMAVFIERLASVLSPPKLISSLVSADQGGCFEGSFISLLFQPIKAVGSLSCRCRLYLNYSHYCLLIAPLRSATPHLDVNFPRITGLASQILPYFELLQNATLITDN
jgi:hypothetical protein